MTPAPFPLSTPLRRVRQARRERVFRQRTLFCRCGRATPAIAGLCRPCYRARAHSRKNFAGQRETVLARDGPHCRSCGAGKSPLHVHHRQPGVHHPDGLVSLCAACHARVHRLAALRRWLPEPLVDLWTEQHPGVPVQLQFALAPERVGA